MVRKRKRKVRRKTQRRNAPSVCLYWKKGRMSGKHLLFSISTGECIIFNCCLFIVCSLYCVFFMCYSPGFSLGFIIWSVRHSSWVMNTFSLCSVLPSCAGTCERICFTRSAYIKHPVLLCWIFIDSLSLYWYYMIAGTLGLMLFLSGSLFFFFPIVAQVFHAIFGWMHYWQKF